MPVFPGTNASGERLHSCFAAETRHSNLHKVQLSSTFFGRSGRSTFAAGSVGRLWRFGRSCP